MARIEDLSDEGLDRQIKKARRLAQEDPSKKKRLRSLLREREIREEEDYSYSRRSRDRNEVGSE